MTQFCYPNDPCGPTVVGFPPSIFLVCASCPTAPNPAQPVDTEVLSRCDDVNGDGSVMRPYWIVVQWDAAGAPMGPQQTIDDTGAAYTPTNPSMCPTPVDLETERLCFRSIATPALQFWRTDVINPTTHSVVTTFWQDATGAIVSAPTGIEPCDANGDRSYTPRTSGMFTGTAAFAIPAPAAPGQLRSFTLMVRSGSVAITNGPDAGKTFPPGSYSWSAPAAAPGQERGFLSFLPAFLGQAGASVTEFMVDWVEG